MEIDFGRPDFLFWKYKETINKLIDEGHEIGWHPHVYTNKKGKWCQNTNKDEIVYELEYLLPYVHKYNLNIVRMGWGFHSNKIMKFLDKEGFLADSSAIPRKKYDWEESTIDWSLTPQHPYYPSLEDYRIPGKPHLNILELPMTTVILPAPNDTERVMRYINPAYKSHVFKKALEQFNDREIVVLICHPYEILQRQNKHALLASNPNDFYKNMENLINSFNQFCTVSEVIK